MQEDYQAVMLQAAQVAGFKDMYEGDFHDLLVETRLYSMTSVERLFDLWKSVRYIVEAGIPGAIIECGVWRGGSMMLAAKTLLSLGVTDRRLLLYDTYEGHSQPPKEWNGDIFGGNGHDQWTPEWNKVSIEDVRANMALTGYPMENVCLVKGKVEDTLPGFSEPVALARLDTDWYESAAVELEVLWPCVSRGGILIMDDYGHYLGQRKACDDYFSDKPIKLNRVDYGCRTAQKV